MYDSTTPPPPPPAIYYPPQAPAPQPKKKKRVFMWVFIAIQVIFAIWLFGAIMSAQGQPEDCASLDAETCNAASDIGAGIAFMLIATLWVMADIVLGIGWAIAKFARR